MCVAVPRSLFKYLWSCDFLVDVCTLSGRRKTADRVVLEQVMSLDDRFRFRFRCCRFRGLFVLASPMPQEFEIPIAFYEGHVEMLFVFGNVQGLQRVRRE